MRKTSPPQSSEEARKTLTTQAAGNGDSHEASRIVFALASNGDSHGATNLRTTWLALQMLGWVAQHAENYPACESATKTSERPLTRPGVTLPEPPSPQKRAHWRPAIIVKPPRIPAIIAVPPRHRRPAPKPGTTDPVCRCCCDSAFPRSGAVYHAHVKHLRACPAGRTAKGNP